MYNLIEHVKNFIESIPPIFSGFFMAFLISILRLIYDKSETSVVRILLESIICGFLTVAVGSGMVALGYDNKLYMFVGGAIGFLGSQSIRTIAYRFLKK